MRLPDVARIGIHFNIGGLTRAHMAQIGLLEVAFHPDHVGDQRHGGLAHVEIVARLQVHLADDAIDGRAHFSMREVKPDLGQLRLGDAVRGHAFQRRIHRTTEHGLRLGHVCRITVALAACRGHVVDRIIQRLLCDQAARAHFAHALQL